MCKIIYTRTIYLWYDYFSLNKCTSLRTVFIYYMMCVHVVRNKNRNQGETYYMKNKILHTSHTHHARGGGGVSCSQAHKINWRSFVNLYSLYLLLQWMSCDFTRTSITYGSTEFITTIYCCTHSTSYFYLGDMWLTILICDSCVFSLSGGAIKK